MSQPPNPQHPAQTQQLDQTLQIRRERVYRELESSLTTIINAVETNVPTVTETVFKVHLLPLLQKPYGDDFVLAWRRYFNEPTLPVNVISDGTNPELLFTIPAFCQRQATTIPNTDNGVTLYHFMEHLKRDYELNQVERANAKTQDFLNSITHIPDYGEVVFKPVRAILQRYGLDFITEANPDGDVAKGPQSTSVSQPATALSHDSFDDDYED